MILKPANIKTKKEFIERVIQGEKFYTMRANPELVVFDETQRNSPFRIGGIPMANSWGELDTLGVEYMWYEDIDRPVPCWVSDVDASKRQCLALITRYASDTERRPFLADDHTEWQFATPVQDHEILSNFE